MTVVLVIFLVFRVDDSISVDCLRGLGTVRGSVDGRSTVLQGLLYSAQDVFHVVSEAIFEFFDYLSDR